MSLSEDAPDVISEIRALLLNDDTLVALVGERVFGGELPERENTSMPRAAVVVTPAGGPGRQKLLKLRNTRVDTHCYGRTLNESWAVHRAVRNVLEEQERHFDSLISVETSMDGQNARDPVKQWPVCYASYRVLSATHL